MALIEITNSSSNNIRNSLYNMINTCNSLNRNVSINNLINFSNRKPIKGRFYGITETGYNMCFAVKHNSEKNIWRILYIGYSGTIPQIEQAVRILLINIRTIMIEYGIKTVYFLFSENEGHVVQNAIRNVLKNAWETDVNGKLINGRLFTSSLEKNNLVRRIIITDNTI